MSKQIERKDQSNMSPEERAAYIDAIISEAETIIKSLHGSEDRAKLLRIATIAVGTANMIQR